MTRRHWVSALVLLVMLATASFALDSRGKEPRDPREHIRRWLAATNQSSALSVTNLESAVREILASPPSANRQARTAWNGTQPFLYESLVSNRFRFHASDRALLVHQGCVVPPDAVFVNYAWAFHEIYQSQLPVYVSVDAVLHALGTANAGIMNEVERRVLVPALERLLEALEAALPRLEAAPRIKHDLSIWLAVAQRLFGKEPAAGVFPKPVLDESRILADKALAASAMETVRLFGRDRVVDWTAWTPRGAYTVDEDMQRYFRTAMWLSRLEFNLVSHSCQSSHPGPVANPEETPHELTLALTLASLIEYDRAAAAALATIEEAWGLFAGPREDLGCSDLLAYGRRAGLVQARGMPVQRPAKVALIDTAAVKRFSTKLAARKPRSVRTHFMPSGSDVLPEIMTPLGARILADARALMPLANPAVPGKAGVALSELAWAFGHEQAKNYLVESLARHAFLTSGLDKARAGISSTKVDGSLFSYWLLALRDLAKKPAGVLPSFMQSEAFLAMRVNSFAAGYAWLRHNAVLVAAQAYDEGGCEIPDGYLDPALGVYKAIGDYARKGQEILRKIDPQDLAEAQHYFWRLERLMRVFVRISEHELTGQAATRAMRRFFSMVAEMLPGGTGAAPSYTGWYFDLFRNVDEALKSAAILADYHTSAYANEVAWAGIRGVRMGLFVVDTGGRPRLMAGPVSDAYEMHAPLGRRFTDSQATSSNVLQLARSPWQTGWMQPMGKEPRCTVIIDDPYASPRIVRLQHADQPGLMTVEVLDHHRKTVASISRMVQAGSNAFVFPSGDDLPGVSMVLIGWKGASFWLPVSWNGLFASLGGMRPLEE